MSVFLFLTRFLSQYWRNQLLFGLLLLQTACVSIENRMLLVSGDTTADGFTDHEHAVCQPLVSAPGASSALAPLDPERIALLNWNIYKGDGDNWQHDLAAFAESHDILTLQEARLRDDLTVMLNQHRLDWTINAAFYLDEQATGVMTASTSSVLHSCGFKTTEPLIRIPKSALVSYYAIEGSEQKLLVANIHGINFTLGMTVYERQLDELYQAVRHHRGPMIIAGDFNSWSDKRMAAVTRFREALQLAALEYEVNNKTHLFGNAIDHVFYRGLEPLGKKVWQVSSSDHNPISVAFRLAPVAEPVLATISR